MTKKYRILKDGTTINTIVASDEFITSYCEANEYTYEEIIEEPTVEPETETEPTIDEILNTLLGVSE